MMGYRLIAGHPGMMGEGEWGGCVPNCLLPLDGLGLGSSLGPGWTLHLLNLGVWVSWVAAMRQGMGWTDGGDVVLLTSTNHQGGRRGRDGLTTGLLAVSCIFRGLRSRGYADWGGGGDVTSSFFICPFFHFVPLTLTH